MKLTHIIVAPAELTLKSTYVRKKFLSILIHNITSEFKRNGIKYEVSCQRGRVIIKTRAVKKASQILRRTFGISYFYACVHVKLSELEKFVRDKWREFIDPKKTFAVRVKRVGKHDFTSVELAAKLGSYVKAKVDLSNPQQVLYVEVRNDDCFISNKKVKCFGGLPVGATGKVVVPIIDSCSLLAAWLMMKRGCEVIPIFFSKRKSKVNDLLKVLKRWSVGRNLRVFTCSLENLDEVESNYKDVVERKVQYYIASRVATLTKGLGIVGSEVLGYHFSDLRLLEFLDHDLPYPVFRPLISFSQKMVNSLANVVGIKVKGRKVGDVDVESLYVIMKKLNMERFIERSLKSLEEVV